MDIQEEVSIRELILHRETHIDFYHEVRQGVTSRRDAIDELESILLAKSEDKSESFMLTKRAQNGILAWALIHNWYMETSGLGISQRMGWVMNPPQSKTDSDDV